MRCWRWYPRPTSDVPPRLPPPYWPPGRAHGDPNITPVCPVSFHPAWVLPTCCRGGGAVYMSSHAPTRPTCCTRSPRGGFITPLPGLPLPLLPPGYLTKGGGGGGGGWGGEGVGVGGGGGGVGVGVWVVRVGLIVVPPQRGIPARPRRPWGISRTPVVIPRRVGQGGPGAHPERVKINLSR